MKYGYACINLSIKNGSPNKRITYKKLKQFSREEQYKLLYEKSKQNLEILYNIVKWNAENNIGAYRISSDIFPLATHKDIYTWWEPTKIFEKELEEIGKIANETNQYLSLHPGQFTVLTNPNKELTKKSINELIHHYNILKSLKLKYIPTINIHGGGKYGNVKKAIENFLKNWDKVPNEVKEMITLENDQTIYNPDEILEICHLTGIPMVFDIAHWEWNKGSISSIKQGLKEAFNTWPKNRMKKIHVSSQKEGVTKHAHADYIEPKDLKDVFEFSEETNEKNFIIMFECKMKNKAILKLREDKII